MTKNVLRALWVSICLMSFGTPTPAFEGNTGWWVVVGSFPAEPWSRQQADLERMQSSAARCGLQVFNDFSGKFRGFRAGFNVFVMGAFEKKETAAQTLRKAQKCFPGAYLKYGEHLGE